MNKTKFTYCHEELQIYYKEPKSSRINMYSAKMFVQGQKQVEQKLHLTLCIRNYNSLNLCLYLTV